MIRLALPFALLMTNASAQEPVTAPVIDAASEQASPWLRDDVVEHAVRATLVALPPPNGQAFGPDRSARFARAFEAARIPSCLHQDGLKFQPTKIGPFTVRGMRAAFPFLIAAKLRGKCE